MTVADILDKAADLIEPEGCWMQGAFGLRKGTCFCAVGAIRAALDVPSITAAENWVDQNARKALGMDAMTIEDWNDAPGRTQAEVVSKLREAAALAREQGK